VKDEGFFQSLENGDELETGEMPNPDTGLVSSYEEIWRTMPTSGTGYVLLESKGKMNKTFLGRIGDVFQGIGYVKGSIHAKRLVHIHGKWEEKFTMGDAEVIPMIDEDDEWNVGDEVEFSGRVWKVLDKDSK
jgi:Protein HRI1